MTTDTITSNVTTGVTLASAGTYGNPVTVASGVEVSGATYAFIIQNPWTVENAGTISGGARGIVVSAASGGYTGAWITNDGTITGGAARNDAGIADGKGPITLDNAGLISGYHGLILTGGLVTNETGGMIEGSSGYGIAAFQSAETIMNSGAIQGSLDGIHLAHYSGSGVSQVDNYGTIGSRYNDGVFISQSYATVENHGTIDGYFTNGVKITSVSAGVVNFGMLEGGGDGVALYGASETLENSGTITGAQRAAYLDASGDNVLVVDPGAVFNGNVVANTDAANTIVLSGASPGTLTGLGSHYQGFQSVTIDNGATWDISGTIAAFESTTLDGFNSHDRLDLTDLSFDAGDTATLNNGSDLLTIENGGGTVLATIQLAGSVTGDLFKLVSDGHGGTFAEESDYTPCYLKGTRIRTPDGEAAVEQLRIGDLVVTWGGEALPLKWIGRRSYRDWLAVGNEDVQPILFKAGSLADRVPARDLYISPEHAMFLDGMLIPARHLVNGDSIVKMEGTDTVDYFHLEFDRHVVIFAEGAPAESFVDDHSRMLFHNAAEYRALYPGEPARRFVEYCAPRVEDGYALEALRRALAARAARLLPTAEVARTPVQQGYVDRATRTPAPPAT